MSKIGKQIILIPKDVDVKIDKGLVIIKGPKGELKRSIPEAIKLSINEQELSVVSSDSSNEGRAIWGLYRALINNMVKGVSQGFEKQLEFKGVGYKAVVKGNDLELSLGFSHPVLIKGSDKISFKVEKNIITVSGIDKELVGQVAANIRSKRKPEPYKGSGIKYKDEVIKRKAGKKAVTAG